MKKFIHVLIVFAVTIVCLSSCNEQEVKPKANGTGASVSDPTGH
jgi:hypothetical protein